MKKITLAILILIFVFISANVALASNSNNGIHEPGTGLSNPELYESGRGTGQGLSDGTSTASEDEGSETDLNNGNQNSNQNQMQNLFQNQVQNQGGESEVKTQQKAGTVNSGSDFDNTQNRSPVANAVRTMLQIAERNGGVGQEIKVIAQNQNQNREKVEEKLSKIESRNGFTKFFIGPRYGDIGEVEKVLEQNREQLNKLVGLRNQLKTAQDQQDLVDQIDTLEQINVEVEEALNSTKKGFSLFGWLNRLINK